MRPRDGDRAGLLVRLAFLAPPLLAFLVVLISVQTPQGLSRTPQSPPTFNGDRAAGFARDLARELPDRAPGAPTARIAADDVQIALQEATGVIPQRGTFEAPGPDGTPVEMENLWLELPGETKEAIIVLAHRDDIAPGPGLDDNASGTAALIELARGAVGIQRARALVVASVDGGTVGQAGARALIDQVREAGLTPVAAIALDAIGGPPGVLPIRFAGEGGIRSPERLLRGLQVAVDDVQQAGPAETASPVLQFLDLIAPSAPTGAQAPFLEEGIAAIQLGDGDGGIGVAAIDEGRLDAVGAAVSTLLVRLDAEPRTAIPAGTYVAISGRVIPGSAIALFALSFLVGPALAVLVAIAARRPRRAELGDATLVVAIGALPGIALVLAARGVDLAGGIDVPPGAPWPEAGALGTVIAILVALVVLAGAVAVAFRRGAPVVPAVVVPVFALLAAVLLAIGSPASVLLAVPAIWVWTLIPPPTALVPRLVWAIAPVVVPALLAFVLRGADLAVLVGAAGTGALPAPLVVGTSGLLGVGALALLAGDRPSRLPVRPTAGVR